MFTYLFWSSNYIPSSAPGMLFKVFGGSCRERTKLRSLDKKPGLLGAGDIVGSVVALYMVNPVWSSSFCIVPQAQPEIFPECRARSYPWVSPAMSPKQKQTPPPQQNKTKQQHMLQLTKLSLDLNVYFQEKKIIWEQAYSLVVRSISYMYDASGSNLGSPGFD